MMASTSTSRLLLASSRSLITSRGRSRNFAHHLAPLYTTSQQEEEHDRHSRYNCIRHFSASSANNKNMRERAVDRCRNGARKGSALAKKGAQTSYQKLKQYGPVFVGAYFSLYVATLGGLYAGVDSGLIDPLTLFSYINGGGAMEESKSTAHLIVEYLDHYALTRPAVPFLEKNPHFANLGVAWVATKLTEPVRLVVTMAVVPRLADYLGFVPKKSEDEDDELQEEATDNESTTQEAEGPEEGELKAEENEAEQPQKKE